jgi:uncharacterized damage-inducible protein DinB
MRSCTILFIATLLACSAVAQSQPPAHAPNTDTNPGITYPRVLGPPVTQVQRILMPLAMAMPDEKYGFAPTNGEFKGVRTFAEQLKHVAASNYSYASAILAEKPPADLGEDENGPASLKTKTEILKYLNDSFSYVQKAVASIDAKNAIQAIKSPFGEGPTTRVAMITLIVGHCYDHYGQLVEYVRMNGIVPPASQR